MSSRLKCCRVRLCLPMIVGVVLGSLGGCAAWDSERWDIDRLRDDRALDIEQRLTQDEPIVENPFH